MSTSNDLFTLYYSFEDLREVFQSHSRKYQLQHLGVMCLVGVDQIDQDNLGYCEAETGNERTDYLRHQHCKQLLQINPGLRLLQFGKGGCDRRESISTDRWPQAWPGPISLLVRNSWKQMLCSAPTDFQPWGTSVYFPHSLKNPPLNYSLKGNQIPLGIVGQLQLPWEVEGDVASTFLCI